METKLLKGLIVLGVPGVALGVFYLLLNRFNFQFEIISPALSALIAILFLLIAGGVTLFALHRWTPPRTTAPTAPRDIDAISETLSEWTRHVYEVKTQWRQAMEQNKPWPGKHFKVVEQENALYSKVLAHLDASSPAEKRLLDAIRDFRDSNDTTTWASRRDVLLSSIQSALRASD